MKRLLLSIFIVSLSVNATENSAPPKHPWQWTVEERIKARVDPSSIVRRRDRYVNKAARYGQNEKLVVEKLAYVVDGSDTPELILPTELWDHLLATAFNSRPDVSSHWREAYTNMAVGIPLPENFWDRLAAHAVAYRRAEEPLAAAIQRRDRPAAETAYRERCHALADTLRSARAEIGDEIFLRFLYESVADGLVIADHKPADPEKLRRDDRGCR